MKIIGRHKNWVSGCTITQSVSEDGETQRFTATIRGWRNFKIYQGRIKRDTIKRITECVTELRNKIDANIESVFDMKEGYYL